MEILRGGKKGDRTYYLELLIENGLGIGTRLTQIVFNSEFPIIPSSIKFWVDLHELRTDL